MKLDDFTKKHLHNWCAPFPDGEDREIVMETALGELPDEDAAYLVGQGWWKVFDSLANCPHCTGRDERDRAHCAFCSATGKIISA
jgi:hypothetical protein